jgi:hypothetical protein
MRSISSKTKIVLSVLFFVFIGLVISLPESADFGSLFVEDAEARVGRPLTPVSYAGVARRTSRRTTRRVATRQAAVYGARVAVLPVGYTTVIVVGVTYYVSGGTYYQPHYEGNTVVYVTVQQP